MGDASSVRIAIAKEVTPGTNPGSGFQYMRFNNEDLRHAQAVVQSGEIDPTRQPAGSVRVNRSAQGSFTSEDSLIVPAAGPATGFDLLHEAACMSAWSTIVSLAAQSIDIGTPSGGAFSVSDAATSAAFTNIADGQWLKLTGFDVNGTIYVHVVQKVNNDNLVCEGVRSGGGAVTAEAGQTDIGIKASMIRIGSTLNTYTLQREFSDLATPEYGLITYGVLASWNWQVTPQGIITQTFNWNGRRHATSTSNGAGTPGVKWATPRLTAPFDVTQKMEASFAALATHRIAEINFTLDNRPRFDFEVGSDEPVVGISTPVLNGAFNVFMDSGDLQRKLEDGTFSQLAWRLDDGTRQRIITFPRISITDGGNPASGNDQSIVQQLNFAAEPDAEGVAFQIDRFD